MSSYKVKLTDMGIQTGTTSTAYVTWSFSKSHISEYNVIWQYATGDGVWFEGYNGSSGTTKQSTYNIPSNATKVRVKVKPVSTTHTTGSGKNKKTVHYWTGAWCSYGTMSGVNAVDRTPATPSAPTVTISESNQLKATLETYDTNTKIVEFQVVYNDSKTYVTGQATVKTKVASFSCYVVPGKRYKVRCRGFNDKTTKDVTITGVGSGLALINSVQFLNGTAYTEGAWGEYSSNVYSVPDFVDFTSMKAYSETSVYLAWSKASTATSYKIQYATDPELLRNNSNDIQSVTVETGTSTIITGLETGTIWYFRVRASNSAGDCKTWSNIVSVVLGSKPAAPTTWSSETVVPLGNSVTLYWVHNSEDGSSQTTAKIEIIVGNGAASTITVPNNRPEDEKDNTSSYVIDTSSYSSDVKILWRVQTAGVTGEFGDWSMQRSISVQIRPTLYLDTSYEETLLSFPIVVTANSGPATQTPIGYFFSIIANETYETEDDIGRTEYVNQGDEIYSEYINSSSRTLTKTISAGDVNLDNNISYTLYCTVSMGSGLTAEAKSPFVVGWTDEELSPNLEFGLNVENLSSLIIPYCEDEDGNLVDDVVLSVYRREFDGDFTLIMDNIENDKQTTVNDPHPALNYARYRVVAMSKSTGAIGFYDMPGEPIGEPSIVIQWDEEWSTFIGDGDDEPVTPRWSGSMLRLPYNIDISESVDLDVTFAKYIGRKHPVSYYGTQQGSTETWSTEIPIDAVEILYSLRRLAVYPGDVYVREPSGKGYYAQVGVSISKKHCAVTIPISLSVTRVDGGDRI